MREIGIAVDCDAVEGHAVSHPDAERRDLVLATIRSDPDADSTLAPFAPNAEPGEGADDPVFEVMDIASQVAAARPEVQHHIRDTLPGPVIGELTAAPCPIDRQGIGQQQVFRPGAGAGGVERRMFQQPDLFRRGSAWIAAARASISAKPSGNRPNPRKSAIPKASVRVALGPFRGAFCLLGHGRFAIPPGSD